MRGTLGKRTAHRMASAQPVDLPSATGYGARPALPCLPMFSMELTLNETRILGCLMEKAVVTPDQYPLTLNALTLSCNQKSSRAPVLALDKGTVRRAASDMEEKELIASEENFRTGVTKYRQRLCNTPFSELQFTNDEYAVVCLLLLRGPQTPGELRTRSGRLHPFADNEAVTATLSALLDPDREGGAVVARLARSPGRRDHQYAHLFSGRIDSAPAEEPARRSQAVVRPSGLAELRDRVLVLEQEVEALKRQLST